MSLPALILQLSIWSILLPLVAGFFYFKQLDEPSRIIFTVVILATPAQLLTVAIIHTQRLNVVYNVYTLLEFLLFYLFIGRNFRRQAFKTISLTAVGLFYLFAVWLVGRHGLYNKFLNELVCAANCTYLVWVFMYILEGSLSEQKLMNPALPFFWFVLGLLFYTPCTIFVFALTHYIQKSTNPFIHNLWSIQGLFNTLMYVLFAVGFYKSRLLARKQKA